MVHKTNNSLAEQIRSLRVHLIHYSKTAKEEWFSFKMFLLISCVHNLSNYSLYNSICYDLIHFNAFHTEISLGILFHYALYFLQH